MSRQARSWRAGRPRTTGGGHPNAARVDPALLLADGHHPFHALTLESLSPPRSLPHQLTHRQRIYTLSFHPSSALPIEMSHPPNKWEPTPKRPKSIPPASVLSRTDPLPLARHHRPPAPDHLNARCGRVVRRGRAASTGSYGTPVAGQHACGVRLACELGANTPTSARATNGARSASSGEPEKAIGPLDPFTDRPVTQPGESPDFSGCVSHGSQRRYLA